MWYIGQGIANLICQPREYLVSASKGSNPQVTLWSMSKLTCWSYRLHAKAITCPFLPAPSYLHPWSLIMLHHLVLMGLSCFSMLKIQCHCRPGMRARASHCLYISTSKTFSSSRSRVEGFLSFAPFLCYQ